jgi:hypothetical protein
MSRHVTSTVMPWGIDLVPIRSAMVASVLAMAVCISAIRRSSSMAASSGDIVRYPPAIST